MLDLSLKQAVDAGSVPQAVPSAELQALRVGAACSNIAVMQKSKTMLKKAGS